MSNSNIVLAALGVVLAVGGCRTHTASLSHERRVDRGGVDILVNAYRNSTQAGAHLTDDGRGGQIVVWQSRRQQAGLDALCGRRVDAEGRLAGPEVRLHDGQRVARWSPVIARGGDTLWAAWVARRADGPRVMARRFDLDLRPLGPAFVVDAEGRAPQDDVAVAARPDGTAVVAWTAPVTPAGPRRLLVRLVSATVPGPTRMIAPEGPGHDRTPAVALDAAGRAVCLWSRTDDGGVPNTLLLRALDAAGQPQGDALELIRDAARSHIEPALALTASGHWQAAWLSSRPDDTYGVSMAHGTLDPLVHSTPSVVLDDAARGATGVGVVLDEAGRATIAWGAYRPDFQTAEIVAVNLSAAGVQVTAPQRVTPRPTTDQRLSSAGVALAHAPRGLAVAWSGDGALGDGSGVHLSVHDLDGVATPVQIGANPHVPPSFNPKHRPRPRKRPDDVPVENAGGGVGFTGIEFTGWNPPDPHMAVGNDHVVLVTNGEVRFYTRDGTLTFVDALHDANGFFGSVGATLFVFDPEVLWDEDSQRYFITAVERDQLPPANGEPFILLAVSDDDDPNGVWYKYRFDIRELAGPGNLDSPNMSIMPEAVFVGADMLSVGGSPQSHFVFILDKNALLDGLDPEPRSLSVPGHRATGIAVMTGDDASAQYFIEADLSFGTHINVEVHAVTDALGTPQFQSTTVAVPAYNNPEDPPSLGTTLRIETFDARFWSCMYRNGSLWATHHVDSQSIRQRWYQIDLQGWPFGGQPAVVQSGDIQPGNGLRTLFGSIWADAADNVALVFSTTSATEYVSMRSTYRLAGDPLDEMRDVETVRESTFPFIQGSPASRRWGDYSAIVGDPDTTGSFWMHSEYKDTTTWKTWVSQAIIDVPQPVIVDSMPPSGASDARQPIGGKGGEAVGWDEIDVLFDRPANPLPEDFLIESSTVSAPQVIDALAMDDVVTVVLDGPIPAGACTTLTYVPDGTTIELGYLPADVDGDGQAATLDILTLIDHLNGIVDPPLETWQCDIDRSTECNPLDVLKVIDLLNGADAFEPWLGRTLPPCP